ncbi:MAG TPA: ABC transporter permease [Gemmataceae bacterium]|jgi:ABC-type Na+ efflux pump permease subunit|nr:ABC transporter permease [Gemmataceae bacterium]
MSTRTLAAKDFRLLRRDYRSAVILLVTPLVFVAVLSLVVGQGFGQTPDNRLRVSVVNLDAGLPPDAGPFPGKPWSEVVLNDLAGTADIRIEMIESREQAKALVDAGKRSAVLVFEPDFSELMHRCSFLTRATPEPLNPLYRDGINPAEVHLAILKDPTQPAAASIIEQVAQVTLFRVVIPWMIGKAFERVGDKEFMRLIEADLKEKPDIPPAVLKDLDPVFQALIAKIFSDPKFKPVLTKHTSALVAGMFDTQKGNFQKVLKELFADGEFLARVGKGIPMGEVLKPAVQDEVGPSVQDGVSQTFSKYDFRAKTWAGLVKSEEQGREGQITKYEDEGLPKRGDIRFQVLIPSYSVTFAFFLVLTVGWVFVAERRQGTLVRLRAAPLTRGQLLLGKLLPALGVSLFQGIFLMVAGKILFGLSWGPQPHWMLAVVASTAFAASGLAMLVAGLARTETQVAIYGTLLVLVLAMAGGTMMPRDFMPDWMRVWSHITPHAWALDAYQQLLLNPEPNYGVVAGACAALVGFGAAFLVAAWRLMRVD